MTTSTIQSLLALIMQGFDSRKYKPIVMWNKTDHNAPYTHRNYVVVNTGVSFRGVGRINVSKNI